MILFTLGASLSYRDLEDTPERVLSYLLALGEVANERREAAMRSAESRSGQR